MSEEEKCEKIVKLPSIPREHDVRFRNKWQRLLGFLCWQIEMEEISLQQDHQYKHKVLAHILDPEEKKFLFALHKVLDFNMNLLRHFEKQSQYQVIFSSNQSRSNINQSN